MNRPEYQPRPTRSRAGGHEGRWGLLFIISLIAMSLLTIAAAHGGEIVIVRSSDAVPYTLAETGYKAALADEHETFRSVLLKDIADHSFDASAGNPDLIVAIGTPAAVYLHSSPHKCPVIFCMVADPEGAGLAGGAEIDGVSTDVPISEQFSLIAQAIPSARVVGMLYRSNTPEGNRILKSVESDLPSDWRLEAVAVDQFSSTADAITELTNRHVDIVWTSLSAGVYDGPTVRALLLAALRTNLPVFGFSPSFVRAGALLGVGVDPVAQGKQAAAITGQILTSPKVDHTSRFEAPQIYQIAVNQIVAEKIGVQLPPDLVNRATYVFKDSD
jgi:ABC-type uncharacterized transport system substrate-binding protein